MPRQRAADVDRQAIASTMSYTGFVRHAAVFESNRLDKIGGNHFLPQKDKTANCEACPHHGTDSIVHSDFNIVHVWLVCGVLFRA